MARQGEALLKNKTNIEEQLVSATQLSHPLTQLLTRLTRLGQDFLARYGRTGPEPTKRVN